MGHLRPGPGRLALRPWAEALGGRADPPDYDAVAAALAGGPVVVLDDLQWASGETVELLVHVARSAPAPLIVVLQRGIEIESAPLAAIARRRECLYIGLESLSPDEAVVLVERAAESRVGPDVLDAIYVESGGNPFFAQELARQLRREDPTGRPPVTVRRAIGLRLAELSEPAQAMLQLAAVFEEGFGFRELEAVTAYDEAQLLDCLDEALEAEFLRVLDDDRYDFARALVRRSLYSRLAPSRRSRVHRRLAEALERDGRPELAAEIARQYLASAELPGAARGVPHALAAAEDATAAGEPVAAARQLDLAARLLDPGDSELRARILGDLALALAAAGHPAEATLALADAVDVHERVGTGGEEIAGLIAAVVAGVLDLMGSPLSLQPLIARGLAALGEQRGLPWARLKLLERPVEVDPRRAGADRPLRRVRSRSRPDHPRARHGDRRGARGRGGRAVAARPLRGLHAGRAPLARPGGAPARRVAAGDQRDRRPLGRLRAARPSACARRSRRSRT